jgi:uncharacterized protein DUF4331
VKQKNHRFIALAIAALVVPVLLIGRAYSSDHADTPNIAANPGEDISDVYMFPSPSNANNVVLVMNVHPLIGAGMGTSTYFDPNVLYQFKIDNTGDGVEDLVIQAKFSGTGPTQQVSITGPLKPSTTGSTNVVEHSSNTTGVYNTTFSPAAGIQAFAGPREDPFFIDLDQLFTIFPDRATPITGTPIANPNAPQATSWRPAPGPGVTNPAVDFLSSHNFNVLSIVIELPRSMLTTPTNSVIGLWETTSIPQ